MSNKTKSCAAYKARLYGQFAKVGRAVANSRRLEILDLLSQGEHTVENIAKEIGTTVSNVSQHLQILRGSGLVTSRKEGLFVHCQLSGNDVAEFWQAMQRLSVGVSSDLRELIAMFVDNRDDLEPVSHAELLKRVRAGRVTVIDVRPSREFDAGHIPQALSIPLEELENRIKDLPRTGEIVAYCRGPYCLLSIEAVERLRALGFRARRMVDGLPEWRAAGHPVAKENE
jgi:rhodanese-related sulfurtransferase